MAITPRLYVYSFIPLHAKSAESCFKMSVNLDFFLICPVLSHRRVNPTTTGPPTSQPSPRQPNFPAVPGSRCHGDDVMLQHRVERRSRRRTKGETLHAATSSTPFSQTVDRARGLGPSCRRTRVRRQLPQFRCETHHTVATTCVR